MSRMKKRLTQSEEFVILKLVLDKFLWLGFGIMAWGFYTMLTGQTARLLQGLYLLFGGAIVLILFIIILMKEYEVLR